MDIANENTERHKDSTIVLQWLKWFSLTGGSSESDREN